jgi:hypothetical protein
MNRAQKIAVFNLVVFVSASLITAVAVTILYYIFGWPAAARGMGFVGLGGLAGLSPLIFKKDPGTVTFDERDKLIHRTATRIGFVSSYLWFCLTGTIFAVLFEPALFKRLGLPIMIFGGAFVVGIVSSMVLLILYGRSNSNE